MADNQRRSKRERAAEAVPRYRDRTRKLAELTKDDDVIIIHEQLREDLEISNQLYPAIKKHLDGSRADSKHLREVCRVAQDTSKRLKLKTNRIDMTPTLTRLFAGRSFRDFTKHFATQHAIPGLRTPVTFVFFDNMPQNYVRQLLNLQPRLAITGRGDEQQLEVKPKRRRLAIESGENAVSAKERTSETEDITSKQVTIIEKELVRMTEKEPVSFYKALVDPTSFPGTVENIFHSAFLLKEGKLGVKKDSTSRPIIETKAAIEGEQTQSILSFTLADYRRWISTMDIRETALNRQELEAVEGLGTNM